MKDEILNALKEATNSYQRSVMHKFGTRKKLVRLQESLDHARLAVIELDRQRWLNDPASTQPK